MNKKFRALRLVATLVKVWAWIVLAGGALLAVLVVILGAVQGQRGAPSPVIGGVPGISQVSGLLGGLAAAAVVVIAAVIQFLLFYAASEVIDLGLAIELNTRETAYYLRGEGALPPPPAPVAWETPVTPVSSES